MAGSLPSSGLRRWVACWGLLAGLLAAQPSTAQTVPSQAGAQTASGQSLTLKALQEIALRCNPTLAQAAAQVEAARGRAVQAGLCPNPTVGYVGEEIGADGTPGLQGIFVNQLIVTGGKLQLARAKFTHETTQADWLALAQQYRVLNSVKLRYCEVLAVQRLVQVHQDLLKLAQDVVTTTEQLINVGQANRPDLLQSRVESRQERIALATAQTSYRAAWQQLAALVGDVSLAPTRLEDILDQDAPQLEWEPTLRQILQCHPELHAARARVARNQCALRREQVEPIPNVDLRVSTQYDAETNNQIASVEVGLPLPIFNKNQGNILTASADLARARHEVSRLELWLQKRLSAVFAQYQASWNEVQEYRKSIVPDTKEAYELYLASFRQRRAAWPQVLIAQRAYFQARTEYVRALLELRRAEVSLYGLLLVDGLDEPAGPSEDRRVEQRDGQREELPELVRGREGRGPDQRVGNMSR